MNTLIHVLYLALCYVLGYLLGMTIAEFINRNFKERMFSHV